MGEFFRAVSIGEVVFSGSLVIALPLALLAGIVAFASPCVLPLVPAYLGYVGGVTGSPENSNQTVLLGQKTRTALGVALVQRFFVMLNDPKNIFDRDYRVGIHNLDKLARRGRGRKSH